MRVLLPGDSSRFGELISSLQAHGKLVLGRIDGLEAALKSASDPELETTVVAPVSGAADVEVTAQLVTAGAKVIAILDAPSEVLKKSLLDQGAAEVLVTPSIERLQSCILTLAGHEQRRELRATSDLEATLRQSGDVLGRGRVTNLSRNGLQLHTEVPLGTGDRVDVEIQMPNWGARQTFFAEVVAAEPVTEGLVRVHGRFDGLLPPEELQIEALVDRHSVERGVPSTVRSDLPREIQMFHRLDADDLRSADMEFAGYRIPALTELELRALGETEPNERLQQVAVARCRVSLFADFHNATRGEPPFQAPGDAMTDEWKASLQSATRWVERSLEQAREAGTESARHWGDLLSRLQVTGEQLDWVLRKTQLTAPRPSPAPTANLVAEHDEELQEVLSQLTGRERPKSSTTAGHAGGRPGGVSLLKLGLYGLGGIAFIAAIIAARAWLIRPPDTNVQREMAFETVLFTIDGVRVGAVYTDEKDRKVVVVDRSWYETPQDQRAEAVAAIVDRVETVGMNGLVVRDVRGGNLAIVDPDGTVTVY